MIGLAAQLQQLNWSCLGAALGSVNSPEQLEKPKQDLLYYRVLTSLFT